MSGSRTFRIAAIPADGVGKEVVAAGREVLDALAASSAISADGTGSAGAFAFDWREFDWGCEYYTRTGQMMPADGLDVLKGFDAIYFGAVGWPGVPDHISLWGLRLAICQNFDQWANIRPVRFLPGVPSPLRQAEGAGLDWVVVRENSEGEYAGMGGRNFAGRGPGGEVALQSALFTEIGCERIMRFAFDLARTRARRKVSSVTKSNAQQYGMVLWDDVFRRVARDYPDVETESVLVDAMAAKFVLRPEDLSVVVASNLHADILSDLGSALSGSLGLAPSANLNPERRFPSMFEPVHGSAPDIAGQGLANPIGAVGSAALMLEHLGLPDQAIRLQAAIEATTAAGVLTRDVGGTATTQDVTKALIDALDTYPPLFSGDGRLSTWSPDAAVSWGSEGDVCAVRAPYWWGPSGKGRRSASHCSAACRNCSSLVGNDKVKGSPA
ncbi:MAG: tartrate dehydrogenase, partial [Trebonia sp.]